MAAKVKQPKIRCTVCGKEQIETEHYKSNSFLFKYTGRMGACKSCVLILYQDMINKYIDLPIAAYHTCRLLDIYFNSDLLQSAYEQSKKQGSNPMQIYLQKVNSLGQYSKLSFADTLDGERVTGIRAIASISSTPQMASAIGNEQDNNEEDGVFVLTDSIVKFWGNVSRFEPQDYEYLNSKYEEYINAYECDTPVMNELLKQAALESLEITHKRGKGKDVSKNLKSLQEVLGSANIKPNQESGANASEQATFGLLIKKWENDRPIPEAEDEWKDVDRIGKYVRVWFLGHLCKMVGVTNEYSKEYETEMAKLRVELPNNSFVDEDEDSAEEEE